MYTGHYDTFNDAINRHGIYATYDEHETVLYHEGKLYDLANEYIERCDDLNMSDADTYLRYMRYHIAAIQAYTYAGVSTDCVMFELLDVQSARHKSDKAA